MSSSRAGPQLVHLGGRGETLANIRRDRLSRVRSYSRRGGGASLRGKALPEKGPGRPGRPGGPGPAPGAQAGQRAGPPRAGRLRLTPAGAVTGQRLPGGESPPTILRTRPGLTWRDGRGAAQQGPRFRVGRGCGSPRGGQAGWGLRATALYRRTLGGERPVNARRAGSRQKFQTGLEAPPRNASRSAHSPMQPIRGAQGAGAPPPRLCVRVTGPVPLAPQAVPSHCAGATSPRRQPGRRV